MISISGCKINAHQEYLDNKLIVLPHTSNSNYILSNNNLYLTTDLYIVRCIDLIPKTWKQSFNVRFHNIKECENNSIKCDNEYYNYDLSPIQTKYDEIINNNNEIPPFRYGFMCKYNDKIGFCRIDYDCNFYFYS